MSDYITDLILEYSTEIPIVGELIETQIAEFKVALAIDKAKKSIIKYTGWTVFEDAYISALITLAINYLNNDQIKLQMVEGKRIQSTKTQGSRSESYIAPLISIDIDGLTEDVKAMLPLPRLKVL